VLDNYQWPGVLDRIEQALGAWTRAPVTVAAGRTA